MLRKTSSFLIRKDVEDLWRNISAGLLRLYWSQYKRRVQQPFHTDQKREHSPEVRWPLPKARDPK